MSKIFNFKKGFSLIEVMVGTAIFLIVAVAVYSSIVSITHLAQGSQARNLAVELAAEQLEIIRNLPYSSIGLTNGIPLGVLPQNQSLNRGGMSFNVLLTIRNINLSTSTVQASDKLVEVEVNCPGCRDFQPVILTGQISPANLQSAGLGGALVTQVFDGNGEPVQGATVLVESVATSTITNTDVTNNYGVLNIIGVPSGVNNYKITVSKNGYSTETTYPIGGQGNPNPTKPHATVLNQQLTQVSFSIDKLSSLRLTSVTPVCSLVTNFDFDLVGAKTIGAGIYKYSESLSTGGSGALDLNSMEWDTYTITPTDAAYDIAGINPDSPFSLNPDTDQEVQLVVVPKNGTSLMVSVIDGTTRLPISDAEVNLSRPGYNTAKYTGQGYLSQVDWIGGFGQVMFTNETQYFSDNGLIDTATSSGDVVMKDIFGLFTTNATGTLESSTFDTGTSSNYYSLSWTPINQPVLSGSNSLKFQFATNSSSTDPWNFLGPDGTADSYFSVPGGSINNFHNGKRYARYKAYLTTETATVTPKLSDVNFVYTSGCIPPGQVLFQNLSTNDYLLSVSKNGYVPYSETISVVNGWQKKTVEMISQ